jgi:AcrR family transcriptional regulator
MPGLRDRKKETRRERILTSALSAFGELGFEAASMAAIAQRAELGVGTLYNYFPSKGDLLLALVRSRSGGIESEMDSVLADRSAGPEEKALGLARSYLVSLAAFNKRIWREFLAFSLSSRPELFAGIRAVDEPFVARLCALIGPGRAELLYGAWIRRVIEYLADDAAPESSLLDAFRADLSALAERRAGAASAG